MSVTAWAEAFVAAQAEIPEISKNKKATIQMKGGGSFSYSYADLPDILTQVRPILAKYGLAAAQSVENNGGEGITITTRIYHKAGHSEKFGPIFMPSAADARAVGSAITYARRYALCAALGIAADEDDDGGIATKSKSKTQAQRPQREGPVGEDVGPGSAPDNTKEWLAQQEEAYGTDKLLMAINEFVTAKGKKAFKKLSDIDTVSATSRYEIGAKLASHDWDAPEQATLENA